MISRLTLAVLFVTVCATLVQCQWGGDQLDIIEENSGGCFELPDCIKRYCGNNSPSYTHTYLPNAKGHKTIEDALKEFSHFFEYQPLEGFPRDCSDYLGVLLCFYYFPQSTCNVPPNPAFGPVPLVAVKACRDICEKTREECHTQRNLFAPVGGWDALRHLNCSLDAFKLMNEENAVANRRGRLSFEICVAGPNHSLPRNNRTFIKNNLPTNAPMTTKAPPETMTPKPPATTEAPSEKTTPKPPATTEAPSEKTTPKPPATTEAPSAKTTSKPPATTEAPSEKTTAKPPATTEAPSEKTTAKPPATTEAPSEKTTAKPPATTEAPSEKTTPKPPATTETTSKSPATTQPPTPKETTTTTVLPTTTPPTKVTTTEPPLKKCPSSCGSRDNVSGKTYRQAENEYTFAIRATVLRPVGQNVYKVRVTKNYRLRYCDGELEISDGSEVTISVPFEHCPGSVTLHDKIGTDVIISGVQGSDGTITLELPCGKGKSLVAFASKRILSRMIRFVTDGNRARLSKC